jgi:predicted nucleic acid-binding protein
LIYLDSSVVLAYLFAEDRSPPTSMWAEPLGSSRLLEYEVWNRLHASRSIAQFGSDARALLARVQFTELTPTVLVRALEAFPVPVRTLDSLHLATAQYLRGENQDVVLASFDVRLLAAAGALSIPLYDF